MGRIGEIKRYRSNLRDELDSAALYRSLAATGADPVRKDLFLQLAHAETDHANLWREKLAAVGIHEEPHITGLKTWLLTRLARRFGPDFVLSTIAAGEFADRNKYAGQSDAQDISAEGTWTCSRPPGSGQIVSAAWIDRS